MIETRCLNCRNVFDGQPTYCPECKTQLYPLSTTKEYTVQVNIPDGKYCDLCSFYNSPDDCVTFMCNLLGEQLRDKDIRVAEEIWDWHSSGRNESQCTHSGRYATFKHPKCPNT